MSDPPYLSLSLSDQHQGLADRAVPTGDATYERDGDELSARGLCLDVGPWRYHLLQVTA
jgi:hypothetical protein